MERSRYTEEQIAFALKQPERGTAVPEVFRKMSVSDTTFHRWRKKFGGLGPSELKRSKQPVSTYHRYGIYRSWPEHQNSITNCFQNRKTPGSYPHSLAAENFLAHCYFP